MPPRRPSKKYQERAKAFAEAVEIGIAVYAAHPLPDEDGLPHLPSAEYARVSNEHARLALEPEPAFASLKSLAYLEEAFFTFWNESTGAHAGAFWARIAARGLPFQRTDVIGGVLARGRIRTMIEYEHVTDAMGVYAHTGKISAAEQRALSDMLGAYEARAGRR